ncbi:hypothetical protein [Modestobacter sp. Leaf380]|uniref:hypothetical protein n=1 Tax=Modestobacter sp. Leaf380 TaxID=1736356 RepID=UPI0012F7CD8A|nr:hypothetical protein [Modestobacter sp. Leaf380]
MSAEREWSRLERVDQPPRDLALQPFALAGVARTILANASDHRGNPPVDNDLRSLCSQFVNLEDPDLALPSGDDRFSSLLRKMAFEQFAEQYSPHENLARSYSLFVDHAVGVSNALTPSDWTEILGVSFDDFMRIGFFLHATLLGASGVISREEIQGAAVDIVLGEIGPGRTLGAIDRHFADSLEGHVRWTQSMELPQREKWSPNSLQRRPLISLAGHFLGPVPHFLIDRVSPSGLYFIGMESVGSAFSDALGEMFERYVGSQLSQLEAAIVEPEVEYWEGKNAKKSCDYFWIFPEVVVLVEVKTARPTIDYRSGKVDAVGDAKRKVGQAYKQILNTERLIVDHHPAFAHIPTDRPRLGMVVTLEPFHLRQTGLDGVSWLQGGIPVGVLGAHDLEELLTHAIGEVGVGAALLDAPRTEMGGIDFLPAVQGYPFKKNPLLEAAFEAWCTWPDPDDFD